MAIVKIKSCEPTECARGILEAKRTDKCKVQATKKRAEEEKENSVRSLREFPI